MPPELPEGTAGRSTIGCGTANQHKLRRMRLNEGVHGGAAREALQREQRNTKWRRFSHLGRRVTSIRRSRIRNIAPAIAAHANIRLFRMAREAFKHA